MGVSTGAEALDELIESAVRILEKGGVVAIPTDTSYGLAALAFDDSAVRRIFRLKGRTLGAPLPLLLADASDVSGLVREIPATAWELMRHFWPGPLTVVLRRRDIVPDIVCAGKETVGLRVPDHRVPRAIAEALGAPITGTSANPSGEAGLTTAAAVRDRFGAELDAVIDGGRTPGGRPSTVVDLTCDPPRILRQGAVPRPDIEAVCGRTVTA